MNPSDLIIPLLLAGAAACGTGRRVNVYAALTRGAEDGLTVLLHVIPALVGLLTAVSMFRASGAMDALAQLCAPVLNLLGIPAETVPLMLVRPVSGSGALAVASDLMASHGPDSYIGRVAAVMLGSTETTFYTIAVYFGSAGIVRTRHTVPAAAVIPHPLSLRRRPGQSHTPEIQSLRCAAFHPPVPARMPVRILPAAPAPVRKSTVFSQWSPLNLRIIFK